MAKKSTAIHRRRRRIHEYVRGVFRLHIRMFDLSQASIAELRCMGITNGAELYGFAYGRGLKKEGGGSLWLLAEVARKALSRKGIGDLGLLPAFEHVGKVGRHSAEAAANSQYLERIETLEKNAQELRSTMADLREELRQSDIMRAKALQRAGEGEGETLIHIGSVIRSGDLPRPGLICPSISEHERCPEPEPIEPHRGC